jgi:hypothetical protein
MLAAASHAQVPGAHWTADVPRTWDDTAMESLELPLPPPAPAPRYITSEYYYRMPVRPVYRSYPVYHPAHEPSDYMAWLRQQEPTVAFDATKLRTKQEWIDAGALVFDAPIEFLSSGTLFEMVRDPAWYASNGVLLTREGELPVMRYVIREQGKVELGILSCGMCHTRVMPDGSTIKGAQGNFPDDRAFAYEARMDAARAADAEQSLEDMRAFMRRNYSAPWRADGPAARTDRMSFEQLASALEAIPPGVCARQGSTPFSPPRIPDLIGLQDRQYFDASGRVRHRDIGDLMRYAALNQGADELTTYGDFLPAGELPEPSTQSRYSDEQLYALALFLYSLEPPANPHGPTALTARGQRVFEQEGCATCHAPPLYTSNKLSPVNQFKVPEQHRRRYDVDPMLIGGDPELTLTTRRGTGYYKVPSLKGLWYRGPLEHNGSVATLEDWFDPRRLRDDYVPTGFRGHGVRARAVPGHPFGLELSAEERTALIAFLKTL